MKTYTRAGILRLSSLTGLVGGMVLSGLFGAVLLTLPSVGLIYAIVVLIGGLVGTAAGLCAGDRIWRHRHRASTSMGVFVPALMAVLGAELTLIVLMMLPSAFGSADIGLWIILRLPTIHGLVAVVVFFASLLILVAVQPLRQFNIIDSSNPV